MKILFLSRLFYPHIGGVEKHVTEVSKRLVEMGHEVTVVSEEISNSSTSEESRSLPRHHPRCLKAYKIPIGKDDWFKKFQIWSWLWKNRELIKEADIVHAHDVAFWYFPFRFLYPHKPFFVTFHGYEKYPPGKKAILIRKISEKISYGNICVGDYIPKWYGTKADYITYGGVNPPPRGSPSATPEVSLPLVFIGRLDEQTEIMSYFEVLKILKDKELDFNLTICGDGSLRNAAESFIKENDLSARILGFVANLEKYLGQVHFVFTSGYLSILEAMAAKRLVFAAFDNLLKEDYLKMAPFSKWVIIESSPEELYNKLIYYTQHPKEEKKLVEKAYNWAREQTWEKVTNIYLKLWGKYLRCEAISHLVCERGK